MFKIKKAEISAEQSKKKRNPKIVQASAMLALSCVFMVVAFIALSSLGFFHMVEGWFTPRGEVRVGSIPDEAQIKSLEGNDVLYHVNNNVVFEHTYAQGTLMFGNPAVSKYNLQFSIYLPKNLQDPIYASPTLKPGEYILSDKLTDTLPVKKGNYTCLCVASAYDSQGNYCGKSTCTVRIEILDN